MLKLTGRRALLGTVAALALVVPLDACDDDGCAAVCVTDPGGEQSAAPAASAAPSAR
jgi:hypothetical protein